MCFSTISPFVLFRKKSLTSSRKASRKTMLDCLIIYDPLLVSNGKSLPRPSPRLAQFAHLCYTPSILVARAYSLSPMQAKPPFQPIPARSSCEKGGSKSGQSGHLLIISSRIVPIWPIEHPPPARQSLHPLQTGFGTYVQGGGKSGQSGHFY